jgi:hypothetical protein
MVERANTGMGKRSDDLTQKVLDYHFQIKNPNNKLVDKIVRKYNKIADGLSNQIILSVKELEDNTRAETDIKNEDPYYRIHLNKDILNTQSVMIARTIVHESSHAFANIPGEIEQEDLQGDIDYRHEHYAHESGYKAQSRDDAVHCADSYAWAALSFYAGRLLTGDEQTLKQ